MVSVEERVKQLIYDQLRTCLDEEVFCGPGDISAEMELTELGADSLDHIELLFAVELEFDVSVDDREGLCWRTVGDVLRSLACCEVLG